MWKSIVLIALRLLLGAVMINGGIDKFSKPRPGPIEVLDRAGGFRDPSDLGTLQKILYISGAKQTGYFWEVLGICEVLFGLLLVFQYTAFVGAVLLLPITLHIVLFHAFLEADEIGSLWRVVALFAINVFLVGYEWPRWKHLLWIPPLAARGTR